MMNEGTFAGTRGNDENAPTPDLLPATWNGEVRPFPDIRLGAKKSIDLYQRSNQRR
jgi:hypothetical protein